MMIGCDRGGGRVLEMKRCYFVSKLDFLKISRIKVTAISDCSVVIWTLFNV